jgi:hypothetical protein
MANVMRLRKGNERPVKAPINQGVAIQVGDLVYEDTDGSAKPAGSFTWNTSIGQTQIDFKAVFWGVSRGQRLGTETLAGTVLLDCRGEFEFPCAALGSQLEAGTYVGPAKQSGNLLEPQILVSVADAAHAIGRLVERAAVGSTVLYVELVSQVLYAGVV